MFHALHLLHDGFVALFVLIHFFPSDFLLNKAAWTGEFPSALQSNTCNSSQKWARFRPVTRLIEVNLAKHKQKKKKKKKKNTTFTPQLVTAHSLLIYSALLAKTLHTFNHISKKGVKRQVFLNCLS